MGSGVNFNNLVEEVNHVDCTTVNENVFKSSTEENEKV